MQCGAAAGRPEELAQGRCHGHCRSVCSGALGEDRARTSHPCSRGAQAVCRERAALPRGLHAATFSFSLRSVCFISGNSQYHQRCHSKHVPDGIPPTRGPRAHRPRGIPKLGRPLAPRWCPVLCTDSRGQAAGGRRALRRGCLLCE